jgi:hypothetical protein
VSRSNSGRRDTDFAQRLRAFISKRGAAASSGFTAAEAAEVLKIAHTRVGRLASDAALRADPRLCDAGLYSTAGLRAILVEQERNRRRRILGRRGGSR